MASSPKLFSFFFVLALFFIQIYARDVQFFSKVSPNPTAAAAAAVNPTTTTVKEDNLNKQEQEPTFMQETQNGYGLYGQESTQFPTTTKLGSAPYTTTTTPTTYIPYKTQTQTQDTYTNYPNTNTNNYYNKEQYSNTYDEQQQSLGETSLQESSYTTTPANQNNNNNYNFNGRNGYNNAERQGMSDTRYLENGKYYYDMKNENNYYPNQYQNSRNNFYDARGYYNSNNNENNYEYNNYQNQEEFQENQNEQYVP